jgi:hypothetical protein
VLKLLHAIGDDKGSCGQKLWRSAIIKAVVVTDDKVAAVEDTIYRLL